MRSRLEQNKRTVVAMGRHDAKAMTAPAVLDSYQRFVRLEQDRQMLAAMGVAG
jgi:hypothetical protein